MTSLWFDTVRGFKKEILELAMDDIALEEGTWIIQHMLEEFLEHTKMETLELMFQESDSKADTIQIFFSEFEDELLEFFIGAWC